MKILVRQECGRERCEEQLEELKEKLREETKRRRVFSHEAPGLKPPRSTSLEHGAWARIEAEAKVTRLLDIIHSITQGTRVPLGQFRLEAAGLQVFVP